MNGKNYLPIITQSLFLMTAVWLISCVNVPVTPGGRELGKIIMHQTGGFAGVSRIITIEEKEEVILLTSVDEQTDKKLESQVSPEDLDKLWQTLEKNDVFVLPTNQEMLAHIADGFGYEITVQRGEQQNQFSVYAPDQLLEGGETRYNDIVQAIEQFTKLQATEEFIIADMPINDISVEILESFPLQVHIMVNGYLSDSCTTLNEITQQRDENVIKVHITTKRPKDEICAQVITEVEERIPIEGTFLPGQYKVIVNEVEKEFELD